MSGIHFDQEQQQQQELQNVPDASPVEARGKSPAGSSEQGSEGAPRNLHNTPPPAAPEAPISESRAKKSTSPAPHQQASPQQTLRPPKQAPYIVRAAGLMLQHGFAMLLAKNNGGHLGGHDALLQEQDFVDLLEGCDPHSGPHGLTVGEAASAQLVKSGKLDCFRFMSEDQGAAWTKANVDREYLSFYGTESSDVTLEVYLARVAPNLLCSMDTVIFALVYIARAVRRKVYFTKRSAHRMFIGAMLVAIKANEEKCYSFQFYHKVSALEPKRLVRLELAMLKAVDYETFVHPAEFAATVYSIRSCLQQIHGDRVNWASISRHLSCPRAPHMPSYEDSASDPTLTPSRMSAIEHVRFRRRENSEDGTDISTFKTLSSPGDLTVSPAVANSSFGMLSNAPVLSMSSSSPDESQRRRTTQPTTYHLVIED